MPGTTSHATNAITLLWSPRLEATLRGILEEYRRADRSHDRNLSTPRLLTLAVKKERKLRDDAMGRIQTALLDAQAPVIDCEVLEAVGQLELTFVAMRAERSS
jgi:hypothetical protein